MKPIFIGRKEELNELHRQTRKNIASLIVVKGRRRIGKSRLVEEFAKDYLFYEFSGVVPTKKTTKQTQINEFSTQFGLAFNIPSPSANDWNNLFLLLAKHTKKGRVVILLDEISWMGSEDPDFLGKLKNAWDLHFKKNPKLLLIICGSSSAWIDKNILSNTAFMGRISYSITLEELPLSDCRIFWEKTENQFSSYDKFKMLSIIGGIPRYLEEIQPQYSAEENIRYLCFKRGGLLTHEFRDIFSDLFGKRSEKYKQIIRLLVQGSLEYSEICTKLAVGKSGLISEYLNDLVMSGFISRDNTWNPKTGITAPLLSKYRLRDNYLRFYLKYIEIKLPEIDRNVYQLKSLSSLPGWASMMGLQFENLVLNNRKFIHQCLNLSADDIVVENPFFQHSKSRQPGCQIDYMIQTRTNVLYVCEIKFSRNELKKDIIKEVKSKLSLLSIPRGMSFCPVLIHVNGVSDSVIDEGYFTEIIDFGDVLK
ncbi:MAG: AAA family ATPase [Gammaproteobacteria bacterium]|nr:AAA family ATPase [Gammaproteobacteria bacterium]MCW5584121.1 AAA family ATPase [Gammaproteobacteria bacterium]